MLDRFLARLEDPERPFLGPVIKFLTIWGVWLSNNPKMLMMSILLQLFETVFIVTEFIDLFYVKASLDLLLTNLKFSMQGAINMCKVWSFIAWQKDWRAVCDYVTRADIANRSSLDPKKKKNIEGFTKYCRIVIYTYGTFTFATGFVVIFQPGFKYLLSSTYRENVKAGREDYMQVISSWVPFNKHEMPGYFFACVIQGLGTFVAAGWITSYDVIALSIMIFIRAELEALKIDTVAIFDASESDAIDRIRDCHKRHIELIHYSELYNSCTSPILLLYTFICTVILCSTAYQITNLETSTMQQLMTVVYLMFGVAQLFLYSWHSNDVLYASMDLIRGPYESKWWTQSPSHQRNLFILVVQLSKTIIFTAGPFTNLTVATFINILKGAYSYYTLL
ncbi:odorant receptor Or2-like [Pieris napi]|uniref:odorant receptor Or2-like n=1 Tax=Pieris napi TaxID=78633 RepID=UPI001FB9C70B|nr:odorant receptor Or2-like [Pieris napi]